MRHRDVGTVGDAVSRLLPQLTPSAVLMTDDPEGAVGLLGRALSGPQALDSPAEALRALARRRCAGRRWSAEQVIESLPPAARRGRRPRPGGGAARAARTGRAAVVLQLVAGLSPARLGVPGPRSTRRTGLRGGPGPTGRGGATRTRAGRGAVPAPRIGAGPAHDRRRTCRTARPAGRRPPAARRRRPRRSPRRSTSAHRARRRRRLSLGAGAAGRRGGRSR